MQGDQCFESGLCSQIDLLVEHKAYDQIYQQFLGRWNGFNGMRSSHAFFDRFFTMDYCPVKSEQTPKIVISGKCTHKQIGITRCSQRWILS